MAAYKKYFLASINNHYPDDYLHISREMELYYKTVEPDILFARTSGNPVDRRLDFCGYFLSLIMALDKRGESFETIKAICLEIVLEYVRPKNQFQVYLKKLPPKLMSTMLASILIRIFHKKISKKSNPNGFVANIITDKEQTFGFGYGIDIIECGICKLFQKHQYIKYVPILCEVDRVTSSMAGLELMRTGTIATGAKICDFRFIKKPD